MAEIVTRNIAHKIKSSALCQVRGRVFQVEQADGQLLVNEILLGAEARVVSVIVKRDEDSAASFSFGCCTMGPQRDKILAVSDGMKRAYLISIGEGELREGSVKATRLSIRGYRCIYFGPRPVQCADDTALIRFPGITDKATCKVSGSHLVVSPFPPSREPPVHPVADMVSLPGWSLLYAGGAPATSKVMVLGPPDGFEHKVITRLQGSGYRELALAPITDDLVLAFCFSSSSSGDNLWVIDVGSQTCSRVTGGPRWKDRGAGQRVFYREGYFYRFCGQDLRAIRRTSLEDVAAHVEKPEIGEALYALLGESRPERQRLKDNERKTRGES